MTSSVILKSFKSDVKIPHLSISISPSILSSLLICKLPDTEIVFIHFHAESVKVRFLYRAFIWMPAHGLDQLVDLLVVFQGVPQGVLSAEQPLAETAHL